MDIVRAFLDNGWVGSSIGVVGVVVALIIYVSSVTTPRIVYQRWGIRLIGGDDKVLPAQVEIRVGDRVVDRLSKTCLVVWNSGRSLIRGSDVVEEDPLTCVFSDGSEVLECRVLKSTRKTNKFSAQRSPTAVNKLDISFDYLDPGDGAVIEILHTDSERFPEVKGTIRGIPRGITFWGDSPSSMRNGPPIGPSSRVLGALVGVGFLLSLTLAAVGLFAPDVVLNQQLLQSSFVRVFFLVLGLLYIVPVVFLILAVRRRYPRQLDVPEISFLGRDTRL